MVRFFKKDNVIVCCTFIFISLSWILLPKGVDATTTANEDSDNLQVEYYSQQVKRILDELKKTPGISSVGESKDTIKGYIKEIRIKINGVEKEIAQLNLALQGVTNTSSEGSTTTNPSLSGLIELKRKKESQLVELRLLLLTSEEASRQIANYIKKEEIKNIFYKERPLWHIGKSKDQPSPPPTVSITQLSQENTLSLYLALFTAAVWILSFSKRVITFIEIHSTKRNTFSSLLIFLSQENSVIKVYWGAILTMVITLCLINLTTTELVILPLIIFSCFYHRVLFLVCTFILNKWRKANSRSASKSESPIPLSFHLFYLTTAGIIAANSLIDIRSELPLSHALSIFILLLLWSVLVFVFVKKIAALIKFQWFQGVKKVTVLFLLVFLCLDAVGYRNLLQTLFISLGHTSLICVMSLLLYDAIEYTIGVFSTNKTKFIKMLHLDTVDSRRTLKTSLALEVLLKICVLFITGMLFLNVWGITDVDSESLRNVFFEGLQFANLTISPARITLAIIVFAICWPMIMYAQQLIDKKWLEPKGMGTSSRESFITISGYVGYGIIIIITLGLAGIKLMGLTVVIGALSVGIGFGLQNIVNNFISGLILIFEQPIKKGDWILVGSTEGYVKKISIRSTVVQTFDRADVIVPNSELISNQVTNMMFDDQRGRVRISVGVAYGSDTQLVHNLLLNVANDHDQVITDGSTPPPRALFQAFGDSSLNFDLLCHIKDVDLKMRIRSELNMAIDEIFKENGVEIPFPQRDVHIK